MNKHHKEIVDSIAHQVGVYSKWDQFLRFVAEPDMEKHIDVLMSLPTREIKKRLQFITYSTIVTANLGEFRIIPIERSQDLVRMSWFVYYTIFNADRVELYDTLEEGVLAFKQAAIADLSFSEGDFDGRLSLSDSQFPQRKSAGVRCGIVWNIKHVKTPNIKLVIFL